MTHNNIIDRYFEYANGNIGPDAKAEIDRHLELCASCAAAFGMLQRAFTSKPIRTLKADPFLPTRIRALAEQRRWTPAVRISFASFVFAVAVSIGLFLGHGLSQSTATAPSEEMVSEFASSLAASDLSDQWMTVLENGNGREQ